MSYHSDDLVGPAADLEYLGHLASGCECAGMRLRTQRQETETILMVNRTNVSLDSMYGDLGGVGCSTLTDDVVKQKALRAL